MQNLYRDSQALVTLFYRNLLGHSRKNSCRQGVWHYAEKENDPSKYSNRASLKQISGPSARRRV